MREMKDKSKPSLWSRSTWPGANIMGHNHTTRTGDPAIMQPISPEQLLPNECLMEAQALPLPRTPQHPPSAVEWTGVSVGVWGAQAAPCYLRARGVFIRFKQQLPPQGSSCSYLIRDALLSHMKLHAVIRQAACTAAKQREAGSGRILQQCLTPARKDWPKNGQLCKPQKLELLPAHRKNVQLIYLLEGSSCFLEDKITILN